MVFIEGLITEQAQGLHPRNDAVFVFSGWQSEVVWVLNNEFEALHP